MLQARNLSPGQRSADLSGYLHKRGHVNTAFRRRFFMLRGAKLTYYEDELAADRGRSKGSVTVARVRHLRPGEAEPLVVDDGLPASHLPYAFHFETVERKPFYVYAESTAGKLEWLRALHQASSRRSVLPASAGAASVSSPSRSAGSGSSAHAVGSTTVEDVYREHVSAAESGLEGTLSEPVAWRHVANGVVHAREGRASEAEAEYAAALADEDSGGKSPSRRSVYKEPVALAALHESGKLHCACGRYEEALSRFERAQALSPPEAARAVRLRCAWCVWQLGRLTQAEQMYVALLEELPICAHALADRARMRLHVGTWAEARTDLDLVVALGNAPPDVLNDLGVCLYELREPREAIRVLSHAIDDASTAADHLTYAKALANRGNAHRAVLMHDEAMSDYDAAVVADPASGAALNNRGALHLLDGRDASAAADLEASLRVQPSLGIAARNLEAARAPGEGEEDTAEGGHEPPPDGVAGAPGVGELAEEEPACASTAAGVVRVPVALD